MTTPTTIGRYQIEAELGRGAMGVVYRALDPELGRRVAVKVVKVAQGLTQAEREAYETRFLNEARVVASLSHPNIVVVYDVGRDGPSGGTPFMALEYVDGGTLAQRLRATGPLDWPEALSLTARLASALSAAHERGVIHRDIKAANVMLLPSGEPKLTDFGIARLPHSQLTAAGDVIGTPCNMSPEQARGDTLDARSDLFALGTVLYEMLTQRAAFEGEAVTQIVANVIQEDPPPPSHFRPGLPKELDALLDRLLAKHPDDRPASAAALIQEIEHLLASAPGAPPPAPPPTRARPPASPASGEPLRSSFGLPDTVVPRGPLVLPPPEPPAPPPAPRPPYLRLLGFVGAAILIGLLAAAGLLQAWRRSLLAPGGPLPPPSPVPTQAPAPPPTEPPATAPPDTAAPAPAPPPPATAALTPRPQRTPAPTRTPPAAAPARLTMTVEHGLTAGRIRVYVDDALVADQSVIAPIVFVTGGNQFVVPAGPHRLRVLLTWKDNKREEVVSGTFAAGATRHLQAKVKGKIGGLLGTGKLALELK